VYADARGVPSGGGRQMTVGLSTTIFGDLGGYYFGNLVIRPAISHYTTPCRQVID